MLRIDPVNIICIIINLLILFVAMKKFLFAPVEQIIAQRQAEAEQQANEVKAAKEEAAAIKAEYEASLKELEQERIETLQNARKDADEQYQRIVFDAKEEAARLKAKAEAEGEREKKIIVESAQKEIADIVVDAARKVASTRNGEELDASLYDEFLNKAGE